MGKCLIIYYSQSGTTAKVAEYITKGLQSVGYNVDLYNIMHAKPRNICQYDLIGIGSPVYFFNPVREIRKYISQCKELSGKPVFIFVAYGTNKGKSIDILQRLVTSKGAKYVGSISCQNANFIIGCPSRKEGYLSLDHISKEELKQAEEFGARLGMELIR
ncbi:flavodoxin domain-containing protein [Thermosyntropha sp.]|uniref:flavodoxin family protein n=1 Tax=Thermosyntropha sp. TaxID=2740820 RepID=UPI0025D55CF0|nr:flavodoxin domain-containing protein [Thermosyntropha sp.]MBO8158754.1 flavodoxin domain-containing protein [Thermosyntropha sp.]